MKLYGLNNIVKCGNTIYYVNCVGERLHLFNVNGSPLYGVTLDNDERALIDDIELSDLVLDALFPRHYYNDNEDKWYWDIDYDFYSIKKVEKDDGLYFLNRGYRTLMSIDTVRELQNAYHFYSDYENEEFLNEDIDEKLKKLFKLI